MQITTRVVQRSAVVVGSVWLGVRKTAGSLGKAER